MKEKHLFVLSNIRAKQINELDPGDVIIWGEKHNKHQNTVLRLFPTPSGNLYTVVMEEKDTKKVSVHRLAAERLVGLV